MKTETLDAYSYGGGQSIAGLLYCDPASKSKPRDWVHVGTAQISVEFFDDAKVVANKVAALKEELRQSRVNQHANEKRIESNIQKLLAITNEVAA